MSFCGGEGEGERKNITGIEIVREDMNKKFYQLKIYVSLLNMYLGTLASLYGYAGGRDEAPLSQ